MTAFLPVEALASLSRQAQEMVAAFPSQAPSVASAAQGLDRRSIAEASAASRSGPSAFGQLVTDGIAQLNDRLIGSQLGLQKLATGDAQSLHRVMIDLEESRLAFQLTMQVRSRLLESYQDIMKMPI